MQRVSIGRRLTQRWMLLVAVAVVAVAGFAVYRLHGIFGSQDVTSTPSGAGNDIVPFNPKHVVMEVFGPPGTVATITYTDVNAQPQRADDATLPWAYDTTTTQPAVFVNVAAQGDSDSIGCRIKIDDVVKDERSVEHPERLHLLPGQVRMSHHGIRPRRSMHRARDASGGSRADRAVLARPGGADECLRAAAGDRRRSAQRVAELPRTRRRCRRVKRIGKVFGEFDSDSSAMIVLEGDQPLGADAHHYYDGLIQKLDAGHQARPAHPGLLGRSADGGGLAERRRQGRLVQVYLAGNQGEALANESVDAVRDIVDRHPAAAGRQGLRHRRGATGHRPVRGRPTRAPLKVTLITIGVIAVMLLIVYRSLVTTVFLVICHGDDRDDRGPRGRRRAGQRRHHRAVDVLDQPADAAGHRRRHRLRDLPRRPLSTKRATPGRTGSPRSTTCTAAPRTSSWVRA